MIKNFKAVIVKNLPVKKPLILITNCSIDKADR